MNKIVGLAFAVFLLATPFSNARADDGVGSTVLSPEDVRAYRNIFAAEKAGQLAKSDSLAEKLEDKSLVGYVLAERYLGSHHHSQFDELKAWLAKYDDLAGADRIYSLARKRAPKKTFVQPPRPPHWRGAIGDGDAFDDVDVESALARRTAQRMKMFVHKGRPEAAHTVLKTLSARPSLPQADIDRLTAYVASAYFFDADDQPALTLSEGALQHGGAAVAQLCWTAGLAAYRLGQFERAAHHFEALTQAGQSAARTFSAASFWAARSWMRAGAPERVVTLYQHAAAEPQTFYGLLAARLLGRDIGADFAEPALDTVSFAALMRNGAAHRAVALWQIGHTDMVEAELAHAFGEIDPGLDAAFAALARHLGAPALELRAAELLSERDVQLTSLYPIPPYQPKGGYAIDRAVVLAFARQESRFQPSALSRVGARGVMQIMPTTAADITHDSSLAKRNKVRLDDPVYSMTLGQDYLRDLLDRQNGNLFGLAAAYNAGAGNLSKWMSLHEGMNDPLLFIESLPPAETRDYIKRVMMNMWMYRKRLGQPADGLDDAASGAWPVYTQSGADSAAH